MSPNITLSFIGATNNLSIYLDLKAVTMSKPPFNLSIINFSLCYFLLPATFLLPTNSVSAQKADGKALAVTDSLTLMLTDNQANFKETVYYYYKGTAQHEVFLVSTVNGKPLYAYVDGVPISGEVMESLARVLDKKRSMPYKPQSATPNGLAKAHLRNARLSATVDSLSSIIKSVSSDLKQQYTPQWHHRLDSLKKGLDAANKAYKDATMEIYRYEIKNIPVDMKLHELLTSIVNKKHYSPEQRAELNKLIAQKRKNDSE
jgi:hypothetical protein